MKKTSQLSIDTLCAKDIHREESSYSHVLPIHATSAFTYSTIEDSISVFKGQEKGFVYSRYGNPTVHEVEKKLAMLEGLNIEEEPACLLTSSGLSAISTFLLSFCEHGDTILTQDDLYGGTTEMIKKVLSRSGIQMITTELSDRAGLDAILQNDKTIKLVYFETPTNPTLKCIDIAGATEICQKHQVLTAIDNTFSTFYIQEPLAMGVDFVLYSTTKFLNGHGNSIAGAIIAKNPEHRKQIWDTMKLLGTNCNPWDAWLLHNGLKTLALRMDRHSANAMAIAQFLDKHPEVSKVNYPGLSMHPTHAFAKNQMKAFGAMLSFELIGGLEAGKQFMNNTRLCAITATLGNVDTLLLHPASSSHLNIPSGIRSASGITDGLVRVSVGIENAQDIIADMAQALETLG